LLKLQTAPDLTFNVLRVQEKEPRYGFSFSLTSPSKRTPPPGSPTRTLWRELPVNRAFFTYLSNSSYKISLNKEIFPFSQRPWEESIAPCSPKVGPLWRHPFPEPHLGYPSASLVKEPSLQVPLTHLPWKEMPHY